MIRREASKPGRDKDTYDKLPLTRWLDKSRHPIPRHPELLVETAAVTKVLAKGDPINQIPKDGDHTEVDHH